MDTRRILILLAAFFLFVSMPGDKTVFAASPDLTHGHFQIQAVTVDEPNAEGIGVPTHEVFLLDTDSGKVWRYHGMIWTHGPDGTTKIIATERFISVSVEQPKQ